MSTPSLTIVALTTLLTTPIAACQDGPAADHAALLRKLQVPDREIAERSTVELIERASADPKMLKACERALSDATDGDYRQRLRRIVLIAGADSPVVDGLKIVLEADRDAVPPGETVELSITVCNTSVRDVVLQTGMSYCGNYFEIGSAIVRVAGDQEQRCSWLLGFCGTGAYPLEQLVPARDIVTFTTTATFTAEQGPALSGPRLQYQMVALPLGEDSDEVRLVVVHDVAKYERVRGHGPKPLAGHRFVGKLRSNELRLGLAP